MPVKLTDCNPAWVSGGAGIGFDPPGAGARVTVFFANPLPGAVDRGPTMPPYDRRWHRQGDTFDTLTLSPSIDAYEVEMDGEGKPTDTRARTIWHGFITRGEVV